MALYSGMVIGGPWAGKIYAGRAARMALVMGPPIAILPGGEVQRFDYVFKMAFGVQLWVPLGWSTDDIAKEVISNYRPSSSFHDIGVAQSY